LAGNSKYHNLVKRRLEPLKEHLGLSHAELEKTFLRLPAVLAYDRVVCGFSWLLRVTDHEAVLMDPKLFSSWVHRSVVLLKRGFGRQTSSRWRCLLAKKCLGGASNSAASDKGHGQAIPVLSTRKIVTRRQKLGWHFLLRR
jgi:hypothetical protein